MLKGLFLREIALLLLVTGAGTGLAAALPRRAGGLVRLALAPVLGFAALISLLTTVSFFAPMRSALWFAVIPFVLTSVALGARAWIARPPALRDLICVAGVAVSVLAVYNAPLDQRNSEGPVTYLVGDAPGYVACINAFESNRTNHPLGRDRSSVPIAERFKPDWSLTVQACDQLKFQHVGSMMLPAAVGAALDWDPFTMATPYVAVAVVLIAFGAMALFTVITRSRSWWVIAAGLLAAGPVALQLFADGSFGYLMGLATLPALAAVGLLALERARWRTTILAGLLAAGMQTSYPEMGSIVVGATLVVVLMVGIGRARRGRSITSLLRVGLPHLAVLGLLAFAFAPRAGIWAVANIIFTQGAFANPTLPQYRLHVREILGWLTQTREFYSFSIGRAQGFTFTLVGLILPALLSLLALWAVFRTRRAGLPLVVLVVAAAQSIYLNASTGCTYCVDRSLIAAAPMVAVLLAVALWQLAAAGRRELAAVLGTALAIAVGFAVVRSSERMVRGAYMPQVDLQGMVNRVHDNVDGTLQMEAFGQTPFDSLAQSPLTYTALQGGTKQRLSIITAYDDYNGATYLGIHPPGDPSYTPDYEWVVTRMTLLDSGRPLVATTPTMQLQRRAGTFDAVLARGVAIDAPDRDPTGQAWLQAPGSPPAGTGPLTFWVSARSRVRAYLRVEIAGPPGIALAAPGPRDTTRPLPTGKTEACVAVPGTGALRIAELPLTGLPAALMPAPTVPNSTEIADQPQPLAARAASLDKVRVGTTPCRSGGSRP